MAVLLRLNTTTDEAVGALWALGPTAVVEEDDGLTAGFAGDDAARAAAGALTDRYPVEVLEVDASPDTAWLAGLAVVQTRRLAVRTPAHRPAPDRVDVVVDPTSAFGHGGHPTTRLALEALDRVARRRASILDFGTGTGVLAIAAVALDAERVVAVDRDPAARRAAVANARRNGVVEHLHVAPKATGRNYDLIAANVTIDVHEAVAADLVDRLAPTGALLVTGILTEQVDRAAAAYAPLVEVVRADAAGWTLLELTCALGR